MSIWAATLLLVFLANCSHGNIFGGQGGHAGRPPLGGGILNPGGHRGLPARGGILGGQPSRGGILGGHGGVGPGGHNDLPGGHRPPATAKAANGKERVRMGPIVFDPQHLQYDDNDEYSDEEVDEQTASKRPHLGLDLSTIFVPLMNFIKFSAKSFESLFKLLEKQANLLLGTLFCKANVV
jgi:hypothetical protein